MIRGEDNPIDLSRWIDADGRITQYPRRAAARAALLQTIGEGLLQPGEHLTEPEVNSRLERHTDDIPTLRRYLIVHGVLSRDADGSAYWRT
ncbi:hypothetical protein AKH00_12250 [Microbacterium sp. GCS4]|nr:hypothetical protein AKH00_12250 [Microbacterium sp. GCS4]